MLCAACELIRKIWLRRRLRWATLGPQYDWTRRRYGSADDAPPLPPYLRDIAIRAADAAARAVGDGAASHAAEAGLVSETGYEPNAALVNFYSGEGDTLCGHQVRPTLHANADATRCGSSRPCYGPTNSPLEDPTASSPRCARGEHIGWEPGLHLASQ